MSASKQTSITQKAIISCLGGIDSHQKSIKHLKHNYRQIINANEVRSARVSQLILNARQSRRVYNNNQTT